MKKLHVSLLGLMFAMIYTNAVNAGTNINKVYGFQDYRGVLDPGTGTGTAAKQITIKTSCCDVGIGPLSMHVDVFTDSITIEVKSAIAVAGKAFINSNIGGGKTQITVVYGVDLNVGGALGPIAGFDPANPQASPVSNEIIINRAGKKYSVPASLMTIEVLRQKFPKYDFDANFYGADPASLVIVGTALLPSAEFSPFYTAP